MDSSDAPADPAEYSAMVRGPSAIFPRGAIWSYWIAYAAAALTLVLLVRDPLSVNLLETLGLAVPAVAMTVIFSRAKVPAFAADDGGIWLCKRSARPLRLEWRHIRQLTISSSPDGAILQILLDPGVRPTGKLQQITSLALPFVSLGTRRGRPGLLTVLPDPPRYRVPLAQVTPEELRSALSVLAPAMPPVEMRL